LKNISPPANINPAQWAAINHPARQLLITAGPGTGKTHTLTHRIAHQLQSLSSQQKILAITFTNKAAEELRQRLSALVKNGDSKLFVGTFHAFCLALLQEYAIEADLPPDFRIASPDEIKILAKDLWPEDKPRQREDKLDEISRFKSTYPASSEEPRTLARYDEALRERKWLDYDDLILEALTLLAGNEKIRSRTQAQYQVGIFVDEYQDINSVQHALLQRLTGKDGRITAIGDPCQAIYAFRGSDVRFFETFTQDFPGAVRLSLTENYRSAASLVAAASQVITSASSTVPELVAKIYQEGHLTIHESATDKAEAEYVVHNIEKLVGGTSMFSHDSGRVGKEEDAHYGFGDMAVLYRLNSQAHILKEAFERSGIPYHISSKKTNEEDDEGPCPIRGEEFEILGDKVTLMTLHAAKGLEFAVVFIVGCEESLLPLNLKDMAADLAEERRLFYVGMTRAKTRLYLVRARTRRLYGKTCHFPASPFLSDIAEELKKYELAAPIKRKKDDEQMKLF